MIKIENIDVCGLEATIRGMRNPMNSWDKSDSFQCDECHGGLCEFDRPGYRDCYCFDENNHFKRNNYVIGDKDLKLMQSLICAGTDHSKFMRMINVTMDITAPRYWWAEADTYKVGTVRNSCSTMHKIHSKEFALDDFSYEHLDGYSLDILENIIIRLNDNRKHYIETKDKDYWWQLIQLLPASYNQKATWQANYQVLRNIYFARRNHKLDEWRDFCGIIEELPYGKDLICLEDK